MIQWKMIAVVVAAYAVTYVVPLCGCIVGGGGMKCTFGGAS